MKRTPHPDAKPMGAFSIAQRSELLRALRHAGGLANFAIVTGGIVGENSDSPKSAAGS